MATMNMKGIRRCREDACLVRVKRNKKRDRMLRSVISQDHWAGQKLSKRVFKVTSFPNPW